MSSRRYKNRPNGSGTCVKLKGRRRKPWAGRGSDIDNYGKHQRPFIGTFETKQECILAVTQFQMQHSEVTNNIKFSELYNRLYADKEKENLTESTLYGVRASFQNWEPLHNREFLTLMTDNYQQIIDERIHSDEPPSLSQLTKDRSLISQMYDYLNERGYSATNYAKFIKFRGIKQEKVRGYTDEEIEVIAKHKTETARVSMILAYTGLRINEFLSLRKFDINLSDNTIFTRGSKTQSGKERTIPIHPRILPHIKHFLTQDNTSEYLFVRNNRKVSDNYYRKNYHKPFMQELDIDLKPHSFRHTAASKFRKSGMSDRAIAEIMGHSSVQITDNVYVDMDTDYLHTQMANVD